MANSNLLAIANLTITDNSGQRLVDQLDLALRKSKLNVLVGESGSGKSLTAKALVQQVPNMLTTHFDSLVYKGQSITGVRNLLGKEIGFISQDYTHSFNDHTKLGKQLLAIYKMHYKVDKTTANNFVKQALKWVDLDPETVMPRYRFN